MKYPAILDQKVELDGGHRGKGEGMHHHILEASVKLSWFELHFAVQSTYYWPIV